MTNCHFIEQIVIQEIKIRSILTENKSLLEDTVVLISLIFLQLHLLKFHQS